MNERNVIRNVEMFSKPEFVNERETREKKKKGGEKTERRKKIISQAFQKGLAWQFRSIIHGRAQFQLQRRTRISTHTYTHARARELEINCTRYSRSKRLIRSNR